MLRVEHHLKFKVFYCWDITLNLKYFTFFEQRLTSYFCYDRMYLSVRGRSPRGDPRKGGLSTGHTCRRPPLLLVLLVPNRQTEFVTPPADGANGDEALTTMCLDDCIIVYL